MVLVLNACIHLMQKSTMLKKKLINFCDKAVEVPFIENYQGLKKALGPLGWKKILNKYVDPRMGMIMVVPMDEMFERFDEFDIGFEESYGRHVAEDFELPEDHPLMKDDNIQFVKLKFMSEISDDDTYKYFLFDCDFTTYDAIDLLAPGDRYEFAINRNGTNYLIVLWHQK